MAAKMVGLSVDPKGNTIINSAEDWKAFDTEIKEVENKKFEAILYKILP